MTGYSTGGYGKIYVENIVVRTHLKLDNLSAEWSKGYDRGISKAEFVLSRTRCKA